MENNASKAGSGTDMGSVSAMASTIAEEIGDPVGKLSESLDAIRSSAERFGTLKTEVDKLMHTKSADTFEMISNLKNIGEVLENVSGDATLNDVPEALDEMQNNIMHVQAFTGELRNLSNSEPKEKAWFNVNDAVNAAIEKMQGKVDDGVTIKAKTATVPEVFGSSEEMQHTIVNMIQNAVDAIKAAGQAKGQIMISTKKHNDRAIISVVDNGQGMDDETRGHVFEPFFSTKERGDSKVSGLGLSVAQRMVAQNDGKIVIKSIPGKGTNFSIVLPLKSSQEAAQA
jgi:signal transduction histidine kinase